MIDVERIGRSQTCCPGAARRQPLERDRLGMEASAPPVVDRRQFQEWAARLLGSRLSACRQSGSLERGEQS